MDGIPIEAKITINHIGENIYGVMASLGVQLGHLAC